MEAALLVAPMSLLAAGVEKPLDAAGAEWARYRGTPPDGVRWRGGDSEPDDDDVDEDESE